MKPQTVTFCLTWVGYILVSMFIFGLAVIHHRVEFSVLLIPMTISVLAGFGFGYIGKNCYQLARTKFDSVRAVFSSGLWKRTNRILIATGFAMFVPVFILAALQERFGYYFWGVYLPLVIVSCVLVSLVSLIGMFVLSPEDPYL